MCAAQCATVQNLPCAVSDLVPARCALQETIRVDLSAFPTTAFFRVEVRTT